MYDAAVDACYNLIGGMLQTYGGNLDYCFMSGTSDITSKHASWKR